MAASRSIYIRRSGAFGFRKLAVVGLGVHGEERAASFLQDAVAGSVGEVHFVYGAADEHDGLAPDAALELPIRVQELQLAHGEHDGPQSVLQPPLVDALVRCRPASGKSLLNTE